MQYVRKQQLLVLLLVMTAQFDQLRDARGGVLPQQFLNTGIDVTTIIPDGFERGSSQQAPARSRMSRTDRLIVGVEQEIEMIVENPISRRWGWSRKLSKNHVV